jgi:hypothetical protein
MDIDGEWTIVQGKIYFVRQFSRVELQTETFFLLPRVHCVALMGFVQ